MRHDRFITRIIERQHRLIRVYDPPRAPAHQGFEGSPCQAGDVIAGRYQIREHAGAGPLGWMYRAFEVNSELDVALKILSPRFLQLAEEKRTFLDELHKAQRLSHANIARIYQAGEDNGRPFVAATPAPVLNRRCLAAAAARRPGGR